MTRKRFIKLLMAHGVPRNEAVVYANACHGKMPHTIMAVFVLGGTPLREVVRPMLMPIMQGLTFTACLEGGTSA